MRKNLFLTTALITLSFIANNAMAENITERQVINSGDERSFNQATADGIESPLLSGGVIKNAGTVNINDSEFTENSADYGGVIYNSGTLNIESSAFDNNYASSSGGAIHNSSNGIVNISGNTTFEGNTHGPNGEDDIPNDIFNVGTLNLNPNENEKIYFGSGIDGDGGDDHGTMNINGQGEVWVKNELIYHDVNLNSGTLILAPSTSAEASRFAIDEQAKFSANNTEFKNSHIEDKDGGAISRTFVYKDNVGDEVVDISSSSFINNKARNGGAVSNKNIGETTGGTSYVCPTIIANSVFNENEAEYNGGAIYNEGTMQIENSEFVGNKTGDSQAYGGAIYNSSKGLLTLNNSDFKNNTAGSSGGAIHNRGTLAIGGNSIFSGNKHTSDNIANDIYNTGSIYLLPDTDETISFEGGIDGDGGEGTVSISGNGKVAISNELTSQNVSIYKGTLELTPSTNVKASHINVANFYEGDTVFNATGVSFTEQNISDGEDGGVIYNYNGDANIADSEFVNNTINSSKSSYGGAILNEGGANISDTLFNNNKIVTSENSDNEDSVTNKGGAIANYAGLDIEKSEFTGNEIVADESDNYGGAINNKLALMIINDSEFNNNKITGNDSNNYGGAINNDEGSVSIANSFFIGNKVTGDNSNNFGGAINNDEDSYVRISNTTFTNNEAGDSGGAINNKEGEINISDTSFTSNKTSYSGGAINNEGGAITVSKGTFTNNKVMHGEDDYMSKYGGAISNESYASMEISDTTFNNNKVRATGGSGSGMGGAINNDKSLLTIANTTFTGNEASGGAVSSGGAIFNSGAIDEEGDSLSIIDISDSAFNNNTSSWGGAIDNSGKLNLTNVSFVENNAEYHNPEFGGVGGAIRNYWLTTVMGGSFTKNTAFLGGAVYNEHNMTVANSVFSDNKANIESESGEVTQGGAIYNIGKLTVSATTFTGNETKSNFVSYGGAISNEGSSSEITISDSTFENNRAMSTEESEGNGGAISNDRGKLTVSNTSFVGNKAYGSVGGPHFGGAIYNYEGTAIITDATFANNETIGSANGSGGAVYNSGTLINEGDMSISNSTFSGNKSSFGGAINNSSKLSITNSTFDGNLAHNYYASGEDYAARGGALINFYGGDVEIVDSTFTNNTALRLGGAIENGGNITFSGNNVFEGNRAGNQLNDIYNTRKITVSGNLTLDGGITGYSAMSPGKITFTDGSNLTVKAGVTSIVNNEVKNEGATLHMKLDNGYTGQYALIADGSTLDNEFTIADNKLYNIAKTEANGTYDISKKSGSEIAASTGATINQAAVISALMEGDGSNQTSNAIAEDITELLQSVNTNDVKIALDAAETLAPNVSPVAAQVTAENINQIFSAVSMRLNGGSATPNLRGMSSGDSLYDKGAAWVQSLYNHSELDDRHNAKGYKADSKGVALGFEKHINKDVKVGVGYGYTQTDIDGHNRDLDVDTHTAIVYGEYKPNNWFINGVASYSWSDYDEEKRVLGRKITGDYDAQSYALQAMTGYDIVYGNTTFTPETGLRLIHISQDGYKDSTSQYIYGSKTNTLTGIIGAKIEQAYTLNNNMTIRPSARLAYTYDMNNDNGNTAVMLANGAAYNIKGEPLKRSGFEADFGITADITDNTSLSLGYQGKFRNHYKDNTGLFNLKYNL